MRTPEESPLSQLLMRWALGAEPELRVGDLKRLHDDVRELMLEQGATEEQVTTCCGPRGAGDELGAVASASDRDIKERHGQELLPTGRGAKTAI